MMLRKEPLLEKVLRHLYLISGMGFRTWLRMVW